MEEILSSIRRIIADEESDDSSTEDDELGAAVQARVEALDQNAESLAHAADEAQDDDEDVLELTKMVRDSGEVVDLQSERPGAEPLVEETEPAAAQDDGDQDIGLADQAFGEASQDDPYGKDEPVQSEPAQATELMSTAAATATGAFAKLSQALQRTPAEESIADDSGRTIEQFVEDIVRPMLKDWLDEHLTAIVERLVEKEIQKISRRAVLN
jgi:cell pole-organizing protein PopZ